MLKSSTSAQPQRPCRGPRFCAGWLPVAMCLALTVGGIALSPAATHAHGLLTSAHSVAETPSGGHLITLSFGLARVQAGQSSAEWICPEVFGVDEDPLDREVLRNVQGLFLFTSGALLRTEDEGCTWQAEKLPVQDKLGAVGHTDTLVWALTTSGDALLKRAGGVWSVVKLPAGVSANSLLAGPQTAAVWLTGTQNGEDVSVASHDGGASWTVRALPTSSVASPVYTAMARGGPDGALMFVRVRAGMGLDQLWRSDDVGESWEAVLAPKPGRDVSAVAFLPDEASGTVLVGSMSAGVWRSVDGGLSYTLQADSPRVACLLPVKGVIAGCADEFIAGAALVSTSDRGLTWSPMTCFGQMGQPAACATICEPLWQQTREAQGLGGSPACATRRVPGPDAVSGQDATSAQDSSTIGGDSSPSEATAVSASRADGCSAARVRPPSRGWPFAALVFLCLGALARLRGARHE